MHHSAPSNYSPFPGPRWEDLRFPAQGINPIGLASPATLDAYGGLSFSGTVDNAIGGVAQMPHAWLVGSTVKPHIHLRFTTSAASDTRWVFRYDIASVTGNFANAYGTFSSLPVVTVANPTNTAKHEIAGLGDLTMTGYKESCIIHWMIERLANSDAADNHTSAVILLEFDLHYQVDWQKPGTVTEYPI